MGIPGMHGIAVVLDAEDFLKVFDMDEEEIRDVLRLTGDDK